VSDDGRRVRDDCGAYLEDAAHFPGGHAAGLVLPESTADVASILADASSVLPIGAQSSLTGGGTPMGELILATSRMKRVLDLSAARVRVEAGLTIAELQEALASVNAWFPPAPTFTGATTGGIAATNASGPSTFKYGSTRDWVEALTVVLADGTVVELARGERVASGRTLELETRGGKVAVPVPSYDMPRTAKRSAGYYAVEGMDAVDLFIGSEGTLGVITELTLKVLSPAPRAALVFLVCASEREGLALAAALRDAAIATWRTREPGGIDVSAIEHMDRRSLEILREDGAHAKFNVHLPPGAELALLVQLELAADATAAGAFDEIQASLDPAAPDVPLVRVCRLLDRFGMLDRAELAVPGDRRRAEELIGLREAVPTGVNDRVGASKRRIDDRIAKTAADMIVPFERFGEMLAAYRRSFESRGLDYAMWGHISDGNVHPNVLPRSYSDVVKGKEAILELGREAARLGGCPLAEHGVGRNPVKQALLRQLYGEAGIDEMRAVKRALDPAWKLAPGVIFGRG
jgi:D-lactate dehydrogenase (cytochrome)